jgi:hypothetical protein
MTIGNNIQSIYGGNTALYAPAGLIPSLSSVNKFGRNRDVNTGTVPEDIWSGGDLAAASPLYTFSTAAAIHYISSSAPGDTEDIEVQGLDASWNVQTITVTLAGQTKTQIGSGETFIRIFRMINKGSTDLVGNVFAYEDDTVSGGVPDTANKIRAIIEGDDNQTQMAIYTIPDGKTGLLTRWEVTASIGNAGNTPAVIAELRMRETGGVFRVQSSQSVNADGGTSVRSYDPYLLIPARSDVLLRAADVGQNSTDITGEFDIYLLDV